LDTTSCLLFSFRIPQSEMLSSPSYLNTMLVKVTAEPPSGSTACR
jgi:hypothetical protein